MIPLSGNVQVKIIGLKKKARLNNEVCYVAVNYRQKCEDQVVGKQLSVGRCSILTSMR